MRVSFLISVFGVSVLLFLVACVQPASAQVIINEVLPDPSATSDRSEWVELYNYSNQDVDLRGWSLDGKLVAATSPVTIPKQSYFIITKTLVDFALEFGSFPNAFELSISLTNSGKTLELVDGLGYKDSFTYTAASPNVSWERRGSGCSDTIKHPTGHSISMINIAYAVECQSAPLPPVISKVQISELFPSPRKDKQESEWLELYNFGDTVVDLAGWKLSDASSAHTLPKYAISPGQHLVLTDLGISLNNSGDEITLSDASLNRVDTFTYKQTESGYAQMRMLTGDKYMSEVEMTAVPTGGLTNYYQAELEVEVVTKKEIVTERVEVPAVCSVLVDSIQAAEPSPSSSNGNYALPTLAVHTLPITELIKGSRLNTWPILLVISTLATLCLLLQLEPLHIKRWGSHQFTKMRNLTMVLVPRVNRLLKVFS